MLSFKHSGLLGDIIYSLPTVKSLIKDNPNHEIVFYLNLGKPYRGEGQLTRHTMLDKSIIDKLIPLLEYQGIPTKVYNNEEVAVDLDDFRALQIDFTKGHLPRMYFYCYKANYNLATPWLTVKPNLDYKDYIIVNRTSRYRNNEISYEFLTDYDVVFVGLPDEYNDFIKMVPNASYKEVKDFLELAEIIAGCKMFIGNQSFGFALAEALKVPRVLEICPFAPNVIPHGDKAWDCYTQSTMEFIISSEGK